MIRNPFYATYTSLVLELLWNGWLQLCNTASSHFACYFWQPTALHVYQLPRHNAVSSRPRQRQPWCALGFITPSDSRHFFLLLLHILHPSLALTQTLGDDRHFRRLDECWRHRISEFVVCLRLLVVMHEHRRRPRILAWGRMQAR